MMSEKRTLLIPGDFPPVVSGIATYFYEIWRRLPVKDNFILCPRDEGWQTCDVVRSLNIIRRKIPTANTLPAKICKGLLYAGWALWLHLQKRFRAVHCGQVLSSGFAGWLLNKLFGVPYIIYVYGSETLRFGRSTLWLKLLTVFLKNARVIVPNSHFTMAEFLALGIPAEKFSIITPGVDLNHFSPRPKDSQLLTQYRLQGKLVLLTVARLDERKGHDQVMRALTKLAPKYPNLVYLIVGKGKEMTRLQQLAQQLAIADRVIFTGYVPDVDLPRFYNLCDVFILLNRQTQVDFRLQGDYEGFGIVFLEASACGKPIIAGDFGGIRDAVEDGRTGFIIDPNNLDLVCEKIELLLRHPELSHVLGTSGRQRCIQYFDWSIITTKIRSILYAESKH